MKIGPKLGHRSRSRMRLEIRSHGLTLTRKQRSRIQLELGILFARFDDRIDRIIVTVSTATKIELPWCEIDVRIEPKHVTVVSSDRDVLVAFEHAAQRAARSVNRAFDLEQLVRG